MKSKRRCATCLRCWDGNRSETSTSKGQRRRKDQTWEKLKNEFAHDGEVFGMHGVMCAR